MRDLLEMESYRDRSARVVALFGEQVLGRHHGIFNLPLPDQPGALVVMISRAEGWEHASVSHPRRCPTWTEMDAVKRLFWKPTETVVQYHPPEAEHVNLHPFCLHLWRPLGGRKLPRPPLELVGGLSDLQLRVKARA